MLHQPSTEPLSFKLRRMQSQMPVKAQKVKALLGSLALESEEMERKLCFNESSPEETSITSSSSALRDGADEHISRKENETPCSEEITQLKYRLSLGPEEGRLNLQDSVFADISSAGSSFVDVTDLANNSNDLGDPFENKGPHSSCGDLFVEVNAPSETRSWCSANQPRSPSSSVTIEDIFVNIKDVLRESDEDNQVQRTIQDEIIKQDEKPELECKQLIKVVCQERDDLKLQLALAQNEIQDMFLALETASNRNSMLIEDRERIESCLNDKKDENRSMEAKIRQLERVRVTQSKAVIDSPPRSKAFNSHDEMASIESSTSRSISRPKRELFGISTPPSPNHQHGNILLELEAGGESGVASLYAFLNEPTASLSAVSSSIRKWIAPMWLVDIRNSFPWIVRYCPHLVVDSDCTLSPVRFALCYFLLLHFFLFVLILPHHIL